MSTTHQESKDHQIRLLTEQRNRAFNLAMEFWLTGRLRSSKQKDRYDQAERDLTDLENELFSNEPCDG